MDATLRIPIQRSRNVFRKRLPITRFRNVFIGRRRTRPLPCQSSSDDLQLPTNDTRDAASSISHDENNEIVKTVKQLSMPKIQNVVLMTTPTVMMRPIHRPSWFEAPSNVILAAVVLCAIRLGRHSLEEQQRMRFGSQVVLDEPLETNRVRALRRKAKENERAAAIETETKRRLEEAERKAKQEAAKKTERERQYKEVQKKEMQRLQTVKQKQREKFEEQEKVMKTELEKRMEIEKQIQAEMEAQRKAEEEERRRIEAEQRQLEMERRKAEEAEKQKQLEEQRAQRIAEKKALDALKTKFFVRFEGETSVRRSRSGITTSGPLSQPAILTVSLRLKPSLSETACEIEDYFAKTEDAIHSMDTLIGNGCRISMENYLSQVRLQAMTGTGPLSRMDDAELNCFARIACIHAHFEVRKILQASIEGFENQSIFEDASKTLQIRVEWGVLPRGHEKRLDHEIESFLNQSTMQMSSKDLQSILLDIWERTFEDMESGFDEAKMACFCAYVQDRCLKLSDNDIYNTVTTTLHAILKEISKKALPDSLLPQSNALSAALGKDHPLSVHFHELAWRNLSPQRKAEMTEKQNRLNAALEARVLQEQWPDREQISSEAMKEREESTPVREQVWALRNVARTLALGSRPSEMALNQSVDLMKKALRLQQKFLGSPNHPGMLGPLKDYASILDRIDKEVSVFIWEQIIGILIEVSDRYRGQGDLFSAAVCAEVGLLQGEKTLDERHASMKKLVKNSESFFEALNDPEKTRLLEIRKGTNGIDLIVDAFTPKLEAYKMPGKLDRLEAWTQNQPLESL